MATASAGLAPLVTGNSSSFGQFRLTQFVESNAPKPPNAITDPLQTPVVTSNRDSDTELMAQSSRPSSGQIIDRTPSTAPSRTTPQDHNQTSSSPSGFGNLELVELTSNPILEGALGPNKDGRVRNPVPSKLKGKTDNKQGNFSVMHMGMSPGKKNENQGRDAAAERDAAARRTSENTALRAKAAQQGKYIPPKQRGLEGNDRASPFGTGDRQRGRPLAPDETKHEQARLLTLLRSINPITVVDQICKAVAYFGGIPGAPPPEDGIFPESANTRETGALFIGWLSEIFPDLSSPEIPRMQPPPTGGKKKGKASKTKVEMPPDEPPNPRNGFGFGQAVSAPAWGLPQSLSLVNTVGLNSTPVGGQAAISAPEPNHRAEQQQQQPPATPIKQLPEDGRSMSTSASKRGRGRPKGSTNKSRKSGAQGSGDVSASTDACGQNHAMTGQHIQQSPQVQGAALNSTEQNQTSYVPANQTGVTSQLHDLQYPPQTWQTNATKNHTGAASKAAPSDGLSPEELAVLNAFRQPGGPATNSMTPNAAPAQLPVQNSTGTGSGAKRKRAPPKPKQPVVVTAPVASNHVGENQPSAQPTQPVQYTPILPPSKGGSAGMAKDSLQWTPVDTSTPTVPPAKRPRQRKPKVAGADPPSRQQTASVVSQPTPPTMPNTIPDSQATSSQQSIPVTRPPAEGLEAHYERFATTSVPQQNGRSHTPSVTSVPSITPQQHLRQLQKPSSVPPQSQQQSPAQTQTQLQMQRQKSQQGQREEQQKMAQTTTARSSSTGFYNQQQRQSTYNTQQYPSHQPSQLSYGTQNTASPQMSNSTYRTNTTHTMNQASPQFSQPENNYKTASPHTNAIGQPSPSFTQPESNFRTASTQRIVQPSPTYSQPENSYRTTSSLTNSSLTNSTPTYSRTPQAQTQTSHQSHYSHFPDATSYVDLPTLESLGHSGGGSSNTMSAGGYGQQGLGVGLGGSSSSTRSGSHSIYGTSSGLGNAFDTGTNDLLRGVSRGAGSNSAYGTSSGLGGFDTEQDMRERLMRMGGRR